MVAQRPVSLRSSLAPKRILPRFRTSKTTESHPQKYLYPPSGERQGPSAIRIHPELKTIDPELIGGTKVYPDK